MTIIVITFVFPVGSAKIAALVLAAIAVAAKVVGHLSRKKAVKK